MKKAKQAYSNFPYWVYKLPIVLLTALVPLILIIKLVPLNKEIIPVMGRGEVVSDLYHYYKMILISITGLYMTGIILHEIFVNKNRFVNFIKKNKILYAIFSMMGLLLLSTVFSKYNYIAFKGFPDRFEGFFVIWAYYVASIYIPYFFGILDIDFNNILKYITFSSLIICTIGIFEYFGYYLVEQKLYSPILKLGIGVNSPLSVKYSFPLHTLASTLYNPNYVGSYIDMVFFTTILFTYINRNKKIAYLGYVAGLIELITLYFSNSLAGLIGLIIGLVALTLLMTLKIGKKKIFYSLLAIGILTTSVITLDELSSEGPGRLRSMFQSYNKYDESMGYLYKDFKVDNDHLTITFKDTTLNLEYDKSNKNVLFTNKAGDMLNFHPSDDNTFLIFDDISYSDFSVAIANEKTPLNNLKVGNLDIYFILDDDGLGYLNYYGKITRTSPTTETLGFSGNERFATNRGYIWSRTLPLVKDMFLLGAGPDCYPMVFPQDDVIGKVNFYDSAKVFVDKPHNMYLQTVINLGIPNLIIFVSLMLIIIFKLFKVALQNQKNTPMALILMGCAAIAYLAAGIANDSTVSIGPIFWSIIGFNLLFFTKKDL